ncbi:MAG: peptidoglycan DD-metalloendopeptidase family protein [Magnetovibrionaceae bacterium]
MAADDTSANGFKAKVRAFVDYAFPERQVVVRTEGRVSFLRVSQRAQMAVTGAILAAFVWGGYSTVSFLLHEQVVADKDNEIITARLAYQSLLDEMAEYQSKFTDITTAMEESHSLMLGLVEQNASLQQNLQTVESQLKQTEEERIKIDAARDALKDKMAEVEDRMRSVASRNFSLRDNLDNIETDLKTALRERNSAQFESNQLKRRNIELETRLASLQDEQAETLARLNDHTIGQISELETVIDMAGVKVDTITEIAGLPSDISAQGGPFVAASLADDPSLPGQGMRQGIDKLNVNLNRAEMLGDIIAKLPLAAPMHTYYITSSFGKRRDPMNKKWAMHYGLDFGGPLGSKVYATAPGKVVHAGWKGNYGRFVEIDHGNGIRTRYGHLKKVLVKKGQEVAFQDKIGLLGNSGRSTGAHLHYEVVFNKKPLNPSKFIKAGRYVFKKP